MSLNPLTLIVEFEIRSDQVDRDQWLKVWRRRAMDAWEHEPETPAYGAAISADHSDRVLIFERYERGEDSLGIHMNRRAHTALMDEMTSRNMTRRRLSLAWIDEVQHWGRWAPEDRSNVVDLTLDVTGLSFDDAHATARFVERSTPVARSIVAEDDDVKILGLGEALRPDDRNPELAAGDLVLVAVTGQSDHDVSHAVCRPLERGQVSFERTYRTVDAGYFWR